MNARTGRKRKREGGRGDGGKWGRGRGGVRDREENEGLKGW